MRDFEKELNPLHGVDDPEMRARMAREFGLGEEMALSGDFGHGDGSEVALNAAIYGHDPDSHLGGVLQNENLIADEKAWRETVLAEKVRAAQFLTRKEVEALYDATTFLNQEKGLTWTALITIAYQPLGITDSDEAAKLLTAFLDEGAKFMRRTGNEFHWIYVHERSDERGLHTHVLAHMPPKMREKFRGWARDGKRSFFRRRCPYVRPGAVDFVMKEPKTRSSKMQWQNDRVSYLTKGLDPQVLARDPADGKMKPVLDLLKQKSHYRRPAGVVPFKVRCGGSRTVWRSAQAEVAAEGMPILSAFREEAWSYLYIDGPELEWPLKEHEVRRSERERRDMTASFETPVGPD